MSYHKAFKGVYLNELFIIRNHKTKFNLLFLVFLNIKPTANHHLINFLGVLNICLLMQIF